MKDAVVKSIGVLNRRLCNHSDENKVKDLVYQRYLMWQKLNGNNLLDRTALWSAIIRLATKILKQRNVWVSRDMLQQRLCMIS